jgi:hypothetical protein
MHPHQLAVAFDRKMHRSDAVAADRKVRPISLAEEHPLPGI